MTTPAHAPTQADAGTDMVRVADLVAQLQLAAFWLAESAETAVGGERVRLDGKVDALMRILGALNTSSQTRPLAPRAELAAGLVDQNPGATLDLAGHGAMQATGLVCTYLASQPTFPPVEAARP